jgi:uncharacterized protein YqeY
MKLHKQIQKEMVEAMKAKEELKLSVLRDLKSAFQNELIATQRKPDEELSDDEALKVIKRKAKQREDSILQFTEGGRTELAEKEKAELEILTTYLPEMMSKEDILKIAEAKKDELGVEDKSKMGVLIGAIMKECQGEADGKDVKEVVASLF